MQNVIHEYMQIYTLKFTIFDSRIFNVCGANLSWKFAAQMVHASSVRTEFYPFIRGLIRPKKANS